LELELVLEGLAEAWPEPARLGKLDWARPLRFLGLRGDVLVWSWEDRFSCLLSWCEDRRLRLLLRGGVRAARSWENKTLRLLRRLLSISGAKMWREFLEVRDGRTAARFARRYGPLGLCPHGRPVGHFQWHDFCRDGPGCCRTWDVFSSSRAWRMWMEKLEHWLLWAEALRSVLTVAYEADLGEVSEGAVQALLASFRGLDDQWSRLSLEAVHHYPEFARAVVLWWLEESLLSRVHLWLKLSPTGDGRLGLQLLLAGFPNGLARIGLQMAAVLCGGQERLAVCAGCGQVKPVAPAARPPRRDCRFFCPECREEGVPARIHAREYRRRKRLREEGPNGQA
jgi:hypothetical protein